MGTAVSLRKGSNDEMPLWMQYLNQFKMHPVKRGLAPIIRDALQATGEPQTALAVHRIDEYYQGEYRLSGAGGISTLYFLVHLYHLVFDVAKFLSCDGPLQDVLVQLAVELQQLPERWCAMNDDTRPLILTARGGPPDRSDIDGLHTAFVAAMDYVSRSRRPNANFNSQQLESLCDQWINLSAFNARCIQSGVLDRYEGACMHPLYEIPQGLEKDHPLGVMRDCFITVAMQYILLAGGKIYHQIVEKSVKGSEAKEQGLSKWKLWIERLKEVAEREDTKLELGRAACEAYFKMVSMHCAAIAELGEPDFT